jgi:hypothetical protein
VVQQEVYRALVVLQELFTPEVLQDIQRQMLFLPTLVMMPAQEKVISQ